MREIPLSLSLASPSMMSRDPDGNNLPEDYPSQLEPSGSRYDDGQIEDTSIMIDDSRDDFKGQTTMEMKKIIDIPPPPPSGKPPKRRKKKINQGDGNDNISYVKDASGPGEEKTSENITNEVCARDDCDANSNDTITKALSPSGEIVNDEITKITSHYNTDVVALGELSGENTVLDVQSQLKSSTVPSDATTLLGDTRASPTARNEEMLGDDVVPYSTVIKSHVSRSNSVIPKENKKTLSSNSKLKSKEQKRTKNRRFFKRFFRGGKNHENNLHNPLIDHASSVVAVPENTSKSLILEDGNLPKPAVLDKSDLHSQLTPVKSVSEPSTSERNDIPDDRLNKTEQSTENLCEEQVQDFCLDPPDNDNGDPPEHPGRPLLSPTASKQNKNYSNKFECEEVENMRLETVRSRIAEIYSNQENFVQTLESNSFSKPEGADFASMLSNDKTDDRTKASDEYSPFQLETDNLVSKDPVGASPF